MANVYDMFFLLQFLTFMVIFMSKTYNIMSLGKFYETKIAWLLFIITIVSYGIGFITLMNNTQVILYIMLFQLETWLILLHVLFMIIELFYHINEAATTPLKAQFSRGE